MPPSFFPFWIRPLKKQSYVEFGGYVTVLPLMLKEKIGRIQEGAGRVLE